MFSWQRQILSSEGLDFAQLASIVTFPVGIGCAAFPQTTRRMGRDEGEFKVISKTDSITLEWVRPCAFSEVMPRPQALHLMGK